MKILIADDDKLLQELIGDILELEGYQTEMASNGLEVLNMLKKDKEISLVLLDIMMPGMNGLVLGANDYIRKPFHKGVLLARIQAVLNVSKREDKSDNLYFGGKLKIDLNSCKVFVGNKLINLTNKEYQLLIYLVENRNIVLGRDGIKKIWTLFLERYT